MKPFEQIFDVHTMLTALTAHIEHNYLGIVGVIYDLGATGRPIPDSLVRSESEQLALLEDRGLILRLAEGMVRENYARKAAWDARVNAVRKGMKSKSTKAQRAARQRDRSAEAEAAKSGRIRKKKAA